MSFTRLSANARFCPRTTLEMQGLQESGGKITLLALPKVPSLLNQWNAELIKYRGNEMQNFSSIEVGR